MCHPWAFFVLCWVVITPIFPSFYVFQGKNHHFILFCAKLLNSIGKIADHHCCRRYSQCHCTIVIWGSLVWIIWSLKIIFPFFLLLKFLKIKSFMSFKSKFTRNSLNSMTKTWQGHESRVVYSLESDGRGNDDVQWHLTVTFFYIKMILFGHEDGLAPKLGRQQPFNDFCAI